MASSRVSGARLDQLLQQAREPAFWLNAGRKILWVNRAWDELTGHPAGSVVGLTCRPHGPTRAGDLLGLAGSFYPPAEALAGRPAGAKTLIIRPDGDRLWRRVEFWPFHDATGELAGLLGLVRPVDDPPLAPDSETQRIRAELLEVRDRLIGRFGLDALIGRGPAHRRLIEQVVAASTTAVPVLVVGESGTGKRRVARTIHQLGPRRDAPLVPLDAAAMPPDALDRVLFGPGGSDGEPAPFPRLAFPEGTTLVLGDVLDLPRDLQGRLAPALDARVRLIATTTADPDACLRDERLRPDLYYALTTLVIRLSPLRERLDELPLMAQHFLERANLRGGRQRPGFSAEALRTLLGYDWPGNLGELARVVDDAHARGDRDEIDDGDLPASIRGHLGAAYEVPAAPLASVSLDDLLSRFERRWIEYAMERTRQNKSRAADLLGISRPRLYRRIKELNLPDEPEPSDDP